MPLKYHVNHTFPSISLVDENEREVSMAELAGGQPLILSFYRGPW